MGSVSSIFGDINPREVPLYGIKQAAGYLDIPASTLRSWMVGVDYPRAHNRTGRFQPLLTAPAGRPLQLSFNNLIEAFVLRAMTREPDDSGRKIELGTVRTAMMNVRDKLGESRPLLSQRFSTDGVSLYIDELGHLLDIGTRGGNQYVLREVVGITKRIEWDSKGLASRLFPFTSKVTDPRIVAIDPTMSFGRPTIEGSGVAVNVVADLASAGESNERIAKEFGLRVKDVGLAVEWYRRATA